MALVSLSNLLWLVFLSLAGVLIYIIHLNWLFFFGRLRKFMEKVYDILFFIEHKLASNWFEWILWIATTSVVLYFVYYLLQIIL